MTVFSRDHKVIGVQYALTAMVFLLLGFLLFAGVLRWLDRSSRVISVAILRLCRPLDSRC